MMIKNVLEYLKGACGVIEISDLRFGETNKHAIEFLNDIKSRVDDRQLKDAYNYLGIA